MSRDLTHINGLTTRFCTVRLAEPVVYCEPHPTTPLSASACADRLFRPRTSGAVRPTIGGWLSEQFRCGLCEFVFGTRLAEVVVETSKSEIKSACAS